MIRKKIGNGIRGVGVFGLAYSLFIFFATYWSWIKSVGIFNALPCVVKKSLACQIGAASWSNPLTGSAGRPYEPFILGIAIIFFGIGTALTWERSSSRRGTGRRTSRGVGQQAASAVSEVESRVVALEKAKVFGIVFDEGEKLFDILTTGEARGARGTWGFFDDSGSLVARKKDGSTSQVGRLETGIFYVGDDAVGKLQS